MFFTLIGIGTFCYGIFYIGLLCFVDCDLRLAFYEKFGKPVRHLQGRVVFITGASSGIGEHTAYALAKCGVKLVLAARRRGELERVKKACIEQSGGKLSYNDVLVLEMDMLDTNSHMKHFDEAVRHFGQVDILFNNAGRSQRAMWETTELFVDKEVFDLNVFAVINLTRIAVNYFTSRGHGHVAVTSSIAGVIPAPYSGSYTGAKHAIQGYYNCLRIEKMAAEVDLTVTTICPGPIYTNFLAESFTEKAGQKYGLSATKEDRRMTGERCGELCAVSLVNKLSETWVSRFPVIPATYLLVYFPIISQILLKVVGPKTLLKLRDSNTQAVTEVNKAK